MMRHIKRLTRRLQVTGGQSGGDKDSAACLKGDLNCSLLLDTLRCSPAEEMNCAGDQERYRRSNPLWGPIDANCEKMRLNDDLKKQCVKRTDDAGCHHPGEVHSRPPRQPTEEKCHQGNCDKVSALKHHNEMMKCNRIVGGNVEFLPIPAITQRELQRQVD